MFSPIASGMIEVFETSSTGVTATFESKSGKRINEWTVFLVKFLIFIIWDGFAPTTPRLKALSRAQSRDRNPFDPAQGKQKTPFGIYEVIVAYPSGFVKQ